MSTISTLRPSRDRPASVTKGVAAILVPAIAGAFLGAAGVVVAYALHPSLTIEMDRSLPRRFASGLYDTERSGDTTFAWTSQRVDIKLADLNRHIAWTCSVRFRGGRSDPATQPSVDVTADGIIATAMKATNEFQDAAIVLPPRNSSGAVVTVTSSSTSVPGPSDPRELGVQIDRIVCAPQAGIAWPPSGTIRDAALIGAIFGCACALAGLTLGFALVTTLAVTAAQALPLSVGPAPYIPFSTTMVWFAGWIAIVMVAAISVLDRWRSHPLQHSARVVIVVSAAVLYLKLLGLLHPSKLLVDALFHAHRFEWVLAGKYFFTQAMPSGVAFPYAIGLYVFALPWSIFTHDHVSLLRVIVCSAQTIAGALLYPLLIKAWGDRVAAVTAVVLFQFVPLPYGLVGTANLTNTFGEAVALAAVLTASLIPPARALPLAVFFLLSVLAFLSHVSTFAVLGVTLASLAVLYRVFGGPALRPSAWWIAGVTIVGAIVAVVLYYGHFVDVYKDALRVRANTPAAGVRTGDAMRVASGSSSNLPLASRMTHAIGFALAMIGWPIVLLALVGVWRSAADGLRDRASLAVLAWAIACGVFLGVAVMRVDAPFQRYASEFFGRVLLATFPAAVVLAARGTAWAWNYRLATRLASAFLVVCAALIGHQSWIAWFL
jgi:hypothetical protein